MKSLIATVLIFAPLSIAQSLAGLWDATVIVKDLEVPFRFEIAGNGPKISASFFNGDAKFTSSSGSFSNGTLIINWDYTASKLEATLHDGLIEGKYFRAGRDSKTVIRFIFLSSHKRLNSRSAL
jgi:hypothetical protein